MTCEGCARAVRNMLGKVQGVQDIQIDVPTKKVTVTGSASTDDMLAAIKKTGKETSLVSRT